MANKKFSEFVLKTSTSDVSHIVGYNGAENVQITPANFVTSGGTGVFLPLAGGTMTGTNGVVFPDNFYLNLGTSSDFEIYHDGNNSYLKDQGTGELILASNGTGIKLEKTSGEKMIHALTDGAVELYYDSALKFATTTTGVSVTGDGTFSAGSTVSGMATLRLDKGANSRNLACDSAGNLDISNAANTTTIFHLQDTALTLGTTIGQGSLDLFIGSLTAAGGLFTAATETRGNIRTTFPSDNSYYSLFSNDGALNLDTYGVGGGIKFKIASSEKMTLSNAGNLGLGTSTPETSLDVSGTIKNFATQSAQTWIQGNGSGLNYGMDIFLTNDLGANQGATRLRSSYGAFGTAGNPNFSISRSTQVQAYGNNPKELNYSESLVIDGSNGNVGIGTATPTIGRLEIGGTSPTLAINSSSNTEPTLFLLRNGGLNGIALLKVLDGGDLKFDTGANGAAQSEKMRITSGGEVLIGKTVVDVSTIGTLIKANGQLLVATDGDNSLDLNRRTNGGNIAVFRQDTTVVGSVTVTASATAYNTSSDYRLKEDLQDFKGLDLISKIPVYDYKWKSSNDRSYGVMAHQLQEVLPQAVRGDKDAEEMQSVDYSKIVPLLVKSIQELKAEIELLKNK